MCGLVSVIIKDNTRVMNKEMVEVFKQMLYADALRGWDSTGVLCVKGNDDTKVIKEACSAGPFFFRNKDVDWAFQNRALLGHNRWATRGSVTAENAHPFTEGDITLAHNGTLRYHRNLANVDVDSHAICHSINKIGAKETLEKLDGAYALTWYDAKDQTIYATRNTERPLHIVETDDLFILVSEKGLAQWILGRNNMPIRNMMECTPHILYAFKENKAHKIYIESSKYKGFKPTAFQPPVQANKPPEQKALPNIQQPNNVHQLRPLIEPAIHDIVIGDKIEVLCWKMHKTQYNNFLLGSVKWEADSLEYPDVTIELYTTDETDYRDMVVTVEVHKLFYSAHLQHTTLICKNPYIEKKEVADEKGPITSSNGVKLTNEVLAAIKDNNCVFCAEPFQMLDEEQFSQIALNPQVANGKVYRYSYYCPNCADFFTLRKYNQRTH